MRTIPKIAMISAAISIALAVQGNVLKAEPGKWQMIGPVVEHG